MTGNGKERAGLSEHLYRAVAKAILHGVDMNIDENPLGRHQLRDPDGVIQAVPSPVDAKRLPDTTRYEITEHRQAAGILAFNDVRNARPHLVRAVTLRAIQLFEHPARRNPHIKPGINGVITGHTNFARRTVLRRRHVERKLLPGTRLIKRTSSQRCIHGEYLSVPDVPRGASLGDLMTMHRNRDINIEHLPRLGVGKVLRGRPYARASGGDLHGRDRSTEGAAAEEKPSTGTEATRDLHRPPKRIVAGL